MSHILDETNSIVNKIADYCKPEKIILLGSAACGQETAKSDIDLFIIKKNEKIRPMRIKEVFEAVRGMNREYPLDPLVYTPDEVNQRLSKGDFFIKNIIDQGKVVYGQ
jgi:predicted nucleotidyltransferase